MLLITTILLYPLASIASTKDDLTIYLVKKEYQRAKYEPSKGIYLGAYVLQDNLVSFNMEKFNELTQKKNASFFKYVGYGKLFPTQWVEEVKSAGAIPHIAWEPNNGLDQVKDDNYLRNFAREAKKAGVPIFLRYASEMNGDWTQYSGKSKQYIEKWRLVHDVMEKEAPNVIMVWTVFTFPDRNISDFYPGDAYVDWVGVNLYSVVYHGFNINVKADLEDPLKLLDYVYNLYSYKKPIQISEYGVTHYTSTDNKSYINFAETKLKQLYGSLPSKYPRVKSIFYFNVNKIDNTPTGKKINNYLLTDNKNILNTYAALIRDKNYLTEVVKEETKFTNEIFSYRGCLFEINGKTYVDIEFFKNYMGLKIKVSGKKAVVSNEVRTATYDVITRQVRKGYYNAYWNIHGLPLRDISQKFGYDINYSKVNNSITLK